MITDMVAATRPAGAVCLVGFASSPKAELDLFEAIRHGTTFYTATAGSREDFAAYLTVMHHKLLRPALARTFPLAQIGAGMDFLAKGSHFGKVVLDVSF
jgi:D-arabinose 1-dehydrogenase-like Zn-dependent alcohol dehydrogenase